MTKPQKTGMSMGVMVAIAVAISVAVSSGQHKSDKAPTPEAAASAEHAN